MLAFDEFGIGFLVALGLGGLIGLEREHRRDATEVIAGVRTFPLMSLTGFMSAIIAKTVGDVAILSVATGGAAAIVVAFLIVRHRLGTTGLTTPMAFFVTFFVGVFVGYGYTQEAVVIGVATTFLLLTKRRLHRFAFNLSDDEMLSALQFLTVSVILFPLTITLVPPVAGLWWLGRGTIIDPYWILLIVIFVSSISFVSFLAMRRAGPARGIPVSGALGGLVSSEATTVSLAHHADTNPELARVALTGTILATVTMIARNFAIVLFADPSGSVAIRMLPALSIMGAVGGFLAWRSGIGDVKAAATIEVKSPFAIGPAIRFAGIFAIVAALQSLAVQYLGDIGVYVTAIGGLVSAGAVIASVVTLFTGGVIGLDTAVLTALLAVLVGAANKVMILKATSEAVFQRAWKPFLLLTGAGAVAVAATWLYLLAT